MHSREVRNCGKYFGRFRQHHHNRCARGARTPPLWPKTVPSALLSARLPHKQAHKRSPVDGPPQVMLFNSASCAVPFTLGYTLAPNAEADDSGSLLEFSTKEGVLPARTHIAVNVRFSPVQRMPYRLVAYCAHGPGAVAGRGASPRSEGSPVSDRGGTTRTGASGVEPDLSALPCCEITGAGAYPCLCISDVRALRVSKAHLWEQFSVNAINAAIAEERTDVDRKTTEFSIQRLIADSPAFRMDFTAGPVGSYPMVVYLQLANNGAMPAHFSFRFPHDTDLQVLPSGTMLRPVRA